EDVQGRPDRRGWGAGALGRAGLWKWRPRRSAEAPFHRRRSAWPEVVRVHGLVAPGVLLQSSARVRGDGPITGLSLTGDVAPPPLPAATAPASYRTRVPKLPVALPSTMVRTWSPRSATTSRRCSAGLPSVKLICAFPVQSALTS